MTKKEETEEEKDVKRWKAKRQVYLLGKASEIISEIKEVSSNQNLSNTDRTFMFNIIIKALELKKKRMRKSDTSLNKKGVIWKF